MSIWFEVLHNRPQESHQFTSDGDHSDLWGFSISEMVEALMQSLLSFPGMRDNAGRLP